MSAPLTTVIVPGYNARGTLEACLGALGEQELPRSLYELVFVDDASTDGTAELAGRLADRVVRLSGGPAGPAAARNAGAAAARGDILVFIDADVVARPSTLGALVQPLRDDPRLDAIFGSYDAQPADGAFVSQYRNLLHHYVHQVSRPEAETFWAGCGAVRRTSFERAGAFDSSRYSRPSIEDIELGHRMRLAGMRIRLAPEIQVKHLKRWTLAGMIRTDILARGIPWMRLLLARRGRGGEVGDLNIRLGAMASIPLAWGSIFLLALAPWKGALVLPAAALALAVGALNASTYAYFGRIRGLAFALGAIPLHFLYHLGNGVSVAAALASRLREAPRAAPSGPGCVPTEHGDRSEPGDGSPSGRRRA